VALPGVFWEGTTFLLAADSRCRTCRESAPFYVRLARHARRKNTQLILAMPNTPEEIEEFARAAGIAPNESIHVDRRVLRSFDLPGFPTLLAVDATGTIRRAWVGRLSDRRQAAVISTVESN